MPSRAMPRNPSTPDLGRPLHDEWGVFDPQQAGMPAAIRALTDTREQQRQAAASILPTPLVAPEAPSVATQSGEAGESGALYAVESPLRCPNCQSEIRTFRALRVVRTHVRFMSTLPRKGYVLVCPECAGLLSAELSGLI
jgi:hypothetical protein